MLGGVSLWFLVVYSKQPGVWLTQEVSKQLGKMGLDKAIGANGSAEKDGSNTIRIPWSKWRETTGVMCDRKIPTKLIDKVYKKIK